MQQPAEGLLCCSARRNRSRTKNWHVGKVDLIFGYIIWPAIFGDVAPKEDTVLLRLLPLFGENI
jgi:hypothetical protein